MLITCGGLCLNHNKWLNNFFIPEKALKPIWKDNVISFIRKSYKNNSLILPAHIKPILGSILNNLYSKIWYVNFGRKLDNASFAIIYIGRYTKRPVIAESRILSYDGEFVIFSYDDQISSQTIYSKLPVDEFIARLIRHIPDKGFRQIRYAGIFALRVRSKLLPTVNNLVEHMDSTDNKGDLSCPPRFTCSVCPDGFMQPIDYTSPSGRTYKTDPKSIKPVQIISF